MANGLINLQTDLKSLRYGSDKPFITKDINHPPTSNEIGLQASRRIDDTSRIAQMLVSKPGLKYLANEALLQQAHAGDQIRKAQSQGKSLVGAVIKQAASTLLGTAKIVGSTLAQVPVNGTGTHFLKGFNTNTYLQPSGPGNNSAFASFFGAGGVEGAPYALRGETVPGKVASSNFYSGDNVVTAALESLDLSKTSNTYTPDSDFNTAITPEGQASRILQTQSIQGSIPNTLSGTVAPTDSTEQFTNTSSDTDTYLSQERSYGTKNTNITKELRVRLGDQGARRGEDKKSNAYWTTSPSKDEIDKINAQSPHEGKLTGETDGRDLVKFRFHILTADGKETVLYFRAFIDSFADNYSGQWNPVKYLGRAEDFQVYSGFQRKISLSFKIAAATRSEMEPIYKKMIWLASATAPTYASEGQFMRGTITKITVGDYIYEQPGVLNSVNYAWNTEYPWEIAMTEPEGIGKDSMQQELPMVMDCSIDFTPIHTFTPTTGLQNYITTSKPENLQGKTLDGLGDTPNVGRDTAPSKK